MVVVSGPAADRLVADRPPPDLDPLQQADRRQLLHHAIDGRARDLLPVIAQPLLDLRRRQGAGLLLEQGDDRAPGRPAAPAAVDQGARGALGPRGRLRRWAHGPSVRAHGTRTSRPRHAQEPVARRRAARRLSSCATCQAPKVAPAGESVSVTVTTGIPCARAVSLTRCTSGVTFWRL